MSKELCPKIEKTLTLISKKWNALIIHILQEGPLKFTEIEKSIPGLSSRLLTERLKSFEKEGIINKNVEVHDKIKIEYELTRKGYDLANSFNDLKEWAEKWL